MSQNLSNSIQELDAQLAKQRAEWKRQQAEWDANRAKWDARNKAFEDWHYASFSVNRQFCNCTDYWYHVDHSLQENMNTYFNYRKKVIHDTYDQTMAALNATAMECD
jgi:hypothetical protein